MSLTVVSSGCGYHANNLSKILGADSFFCRPEEKLLTESVIWFVGVFQKELEFLYKFRKDLMHKKVILHFVGTDVLFFNDRVRGVVERGGIDFPKLKSDIKQEFIDMFNNPNFKILGQGKHLVTELQEVGMGNVEVLTMVDNSCKFRSFPKEPAVLCYLPERRDFFNLSKILELANRFSNVSFYFYGGLIFNSILDNVKNLGWISGKDKEELYNLVTVNLRIPFHDGIPLSLIELEQRGARTLWIYDSLPFIKSIGGNFEIEFLSDSLSSLLEYRNPDKLASDYYLDKYNVQNFKKQAISILNAL